MRIFQYIALGTTGYSAVLGLIAHFRNARPYDALTIHAILTPLFETIQSMFKVRIPQGVTLACIASCVTIIEEHRSKPI